MIDDPGSEFATPEELAALLHGLTDGAMGRASVAYVQRGGLLADRVMAELPPVRHKLMGRPRG